MMADDKEREIQELRSRLSALENQTRPSSTTAHQNGGCLGIVLAVIATVGLVSYCGARGSGPSAPPDTYRLVHAIGNAEKIVAQDLSKAECEAQKSELKAVATALGAYNEATGYGSITCLPEEYFQ